jgi:CRISPR/Cas system endoribonuclease Cas6 (RAMP superfamily)
VQQGKLKGELSGLNEMITDLIDKKNGVLSDYEQVVKEKKAYKRLRKNLEEEYEGYLFMLDGDYCKRLDEES